MTAPKSAFARYATAFVVYLLFVILFGAWVRITHSGAGCGSHWPTCNGEVIPFEPSAETIIEYTHRLTSGLLGIFGLVLVGWAWAKHRGGRVFKAAVVTLILIVFEALIGAGLVLRELVKDDASVARAIVISLHLANTLILTSAATLTVYWDQRPERLTFGAHPRLLAACALALIALVATSMTGAVTALGDTLFPVDPTSGALLNRLQSDLSVANHFLVRLRVVHPALAVLTALGVGLLSRFVGSRNVDDRTKWWASALTVGLMAQVGLGVMNIALAAPGWMQLSHLLLAQLVWIAALLLTVSLAATTSPTLARDEQIV